MAQDEQALRLPTMITGHGERIHPPVGGLPIVTYKCDDGKTYTRRQLCAIFNLKDECIYRRVMSHGLNNPTVFLSPGDYKAEKERRTRQGVEERRRLLLAERERCRQERIKAGRGDRIYRGATPIDRPRDENLRKMRPLGSWEREQLAKESDAQC